MSSAAAHAAATKACDVNASPRPQSVGKPLLYFCLAESRCGHIGMAQPHLLRKVRCCCCRRSRCAAALTPQRRVRSSPFCSESCAGPSSNAAAAPATPQQLAHTKVYGDQSTIPHDHMHAPLHASPMTEHFRCAASPMTLVKQDLKPPPVAGSASCGGAAPMPPAASVSAAAAAASSTCPVPKHAGHALWKCYACQDPIRCHRALLASWATTQSRA